MYKIIGERNKVNYGCIDERIDFNYADFVLRGFFGKKIGPLRKKCAFHAFNYIGILTDDFLIGIAAIDLGYMKNVFAYVYNYKDGIIFEYDKKATDRGPLSFPVNPDEYKIEWHKGKTFLSIEKSHERGMLTLEADFEGGLQIRAVLPYSLGTHHPLRVLNPSEPTRWTFTEKCAPLFCEELSIVLNGRPLAFRKETAAALYDWSAGFMRRDTNWFWAAFAGVLDDGRKTAIGLNLAALINESFFPENAFWIDSVRTRTAQCIWDYNPANPYEAWHIWNESGTVDITFSPQGERSAKIRTGIVNTNFTQFMGTFAGTLVPGSGEAVSFAGVRGFAELHRARW